MHPALQKTFGGLSAPYYSRHLFFGLVFAAIFLLSIRSLPGAKSLAVLLCVVNTLLYPYARFVYEGVVGFILGNNVFFVSAVPMLLVKAMTMFICWMLAICIAPIGLAYLYFRSSRQ